MRQDILRFLIESITEVTEGDQNMSRGLTDDSDGIFVPRGKVACSVSGVGLIGCLEKSDALTPAVQNRFRMD